MKMIVLMCMSHDRPLKDALKSYLGWQATGSSPAA
jgi:hypothetical protein